MNKRGGFTLVELVVVIVALGILAGLGAIGITRYQADTRDAQRGANAGIISNALESYFTQNGSYPSCQAMTANAEVLTSTTLKGLNKEALLVPGSTPSESNAIRCGQALALTGDDFIEYQGDGSVACNGSGACSSYTLIYRSELNNSLSKLPSHGLIAKAVTETVQIPATPTAPIVATSPTPTTPAISKPAPTINPPMQVTAAVNTAAQVTVAWQASAKATGYTVKYGLSEDALTHSATTKKTSVPITAHITQGTEWFFKVYATAGRVESSDSAVAKITTPINTPAAYTLTSTNDGASLTGIASSASCPAGTTKYYSWKANNTAWVQGAQHAQVTYSLSKGQGVSLQAATKCQKGTVASGYTVSNNSVSFTRPSVGLVLVPGNDECAGCR